MTGHKDPPVASKEYWKLPPAEQLRIAEEAAGIFRDGSGTGAFVSGGKPYADGDPIKCPIDQW